MSSSGSSDSFQRPATPNYYQVLGVAPDASPSAVRKAYKKKALASHPDRCSSRQGSRPSTSDQQSPVVGSPPQADRANTAFSGARLPRPSKRAPPTPVSGESVCVVDAPIDEKEATMQFQLIGEAYAVLADDTKRFQYDSEFGFTDAGCNGDDSSDDDGGVNDSLLSALNGGRCTPSGGGRTAGVSFSCTFPAAGTSSTPGSASPTFLPRGGGGGADCTSPSFTAGPTHVPDMLRREQQGRAPPVAGATFSTGHSGEDGREGRRQTGSRAGSRQSSKPMGHTTTSTRSGNTPKECPIADGTVPQSTTFLFGVGTGRHAGAATSGPRARSTTPFSASINGGASSASGTTRRCSTPAASETHRSNLDVDYNQSVAIQSRWERQFQFSRDGRVQRRSDHRYFKAQSQAEGNSSTTDGTPNRNNTFHRTAAAGRSGGRGLPPVAVERKEGSPSQQRDWAARHVEQRRQQRLGTPATASRSSGNTRTNTATATTGTPHPATASRKSGRRKSANDVTPSEQRGADDGDGSPPGRGGDRLGLGAARPSSRASERIAEARRRTQEIFFS